MKRQIEWSESPLIANEGNNNSFSLLLKRITNEPLPWFVILVIAFGVMIYAYQSRITTLNDRLSAMNDRLGSIEAKADDASHAAFDATTHAYVSDDHIQTLRELMAAQGVRNLPTFKHEDKPKCQP